MNDFNRVGHLDEKKRDELLREGENYIEDANVALDELYGQRLETSVS